MSYRVVTNGVSYKVQYEEHAAVASEVPIILWNDTGYESLSKDDAIKHRDILGLKWEVVE